MQRHGAGIQQFLAKMRMPREDIHEIGVADPEHGMQGEEFGPRFGVEGFLVFVGAEGRDPCAGLLVAEESPE